MADPKVRKENPIPPWNRIAASRPSAMRAERLAIQREEPLHNVMHAKRALR
jgi:hypothetical protein